MGGETDPKTLAAGDGKARQIGNALHPCDVLTFRSGQINTPLARQCRLGFFVARRVPTKRVRLRRCFVTDS